MNLPEKSLAAAEFKTVCEIDYSSLEDIVTEFFRGAKPGDSDYLQKRYDSVDENGWRNDCQYSFHVSKRNRIFCGEEKLLEHAKRGIWESIDDILTYLCKQEIVPECELVVRVCW